MIIHMFELTNFLIIFFIGLIFVNYIRLFLKVSQTRAIFIYFYHTFFMFAKIIYGDLYPDDGVTYFEWAVSDTYYLFSLKSHFYLIYALRFLNFVLDLTYLEICLLFNIIGTIGFLFLLSVYQNIPSKIYTNIDKLLILLFILSPSLTFHTSSIGKDTLVIFGASIFLYSILNINNRLLLFVLSIAIITLIRPYVIIFFFFFFIFLYITKFTKISFLNNLIIITVLFSLLIILPTTILSEYNFRFYDLSYILDFINTREASYQAANTYIDLQNMFFLFKPFSYLFRPFIFESLNFMQIIVSFENLLLVFIFLYYFPKLYFKNLFYSNTSFYLLILSIVLLIFLSNITPVLGMAVRQKWIILIFIFHLFLQYSSEHSKHYKK